MNMEQAAKVGGDDVEGSFKGPIQHAHRLYPAIRWTFLGPIMVQLFARSGSRTSCSGFEILCRRPFVSRDFKAGCRSTFTAVAMHAMAIVAGRPALFAAHKKAHKTVDLG